MSTLDKTQIALIIPVILLYLALLLTAIIDLTKNWNERKKSGYLASCYYRYQHFWPNCLLYFWPKRGR